MTQPTPSSQLLYQDDGFLVAGLERNGVRHLSVAEPGATYAAIDATALISRLAGHPDPRLREALIPLFLRQPDLAKLVPGLVDKLDPSEANVLRHFYTAAVYLQRLWLTTLGMHLGRFPLLPDHFGEATYHLPPPGEHFGEAGLRRLAEINADKTGFEWLSVYQTTMNLFLQQLSLDGEIHD